MTVMRHSVRRAERWSSPLWLWPIAAGIAALLAALVMVDLRLPSSVDWVAWPGSADSAVALLQSLVASVITVTGLIFTLTIVALQLASQQFSPRLLRNFTRDPVIKICLSVLVATLIFSATVMRSIGPEDDLPHVALLIAQLMGVAALGAVLAFIAHLVRNLRVDTMMRVVHDETKNAIETFYPLYGDTAGASDGAEFPPPADGDMIFAGRSGFVRVIDVRALVLTAQQEQLLVRVEVRPGDHVVRGAPLATVWGSPAGGAERSGAAVGKHIVIGYERTVEQDASFGFRQLTDIAVKAISPGINDPVTAAHAIGHVAELMVQLMGRRLGGTVHQDDEGVDRALVPDRDLRYYLDLVCAPVRRYGRADPTVLTALLRMLRDAAAAARDEEQREELAVQAQLIRDEVPESLAERDVAEVQAMTDRVLQALGGDVRGSYWDRSGETRSV